MSIFTHINNQRLKLPSAAGGNRSFALTGVAPSKAPCAPPGVARSLSAIRWASGHLKFKNFGGLAMVVCIPCRLA
jgi:hypothetical protein